MVFIAMSIEGIDLDPDPLYEIIKNHQIILMTDIKDPSIATFILNDY